MRQSNIFLYTLLPEVFSCVHACGISIEIHPEGTTGHLFLFSNTEAATPPQNPLGYCWALHYISYAAGDSEMTRFRMSNLKSHFTVVC